MSIFDNKKRYQTEGWTPITEPREFTSEEKAQVISCKVKLGEYGLSACFLMRSGGSIYIPFTKAGKERVTENQVIDVNDLMTITLAKDGKEIDRVELK